MEVEESNVPKEVCNHDTGEVIACSHPKTIQIVLRDLFILCFSIFLSSMAYCGLINLQTSLNDDNKLGNKTLTVVYFFAMLSTLFLTTTTITKLGLKWTLIVSIFTQVAYPLSNFWPVWYTMYPGAAITGLGTGPLWSASNAYLMALGSQYTTSAAAETSEAAISVFFGIFFMAQRISTVTGSLISSLIFQRSKKAEFLPVSVIESFCGAHYCYEDIDQLFLDCTANSSFGDSDAISSNGTAGSSNLYRPSDLQRNLLFGTYLSCSLLAVPLMGLLRPLDSNNRPKGELLLMKTLMETIRMMVNPKQLLLLPLSVFSGVTYAFSTADYIVGYITCSVGIDQIGYVMAAFGVASALGSVVCGPLVKYCGRQAIFAFGGICNVSTLLALIMWTPTSEVTLILYVFAGLLGLTCIIWVSQLAAFVGFMFADYHPETAFAAFLLFQMFGNFAWHAFSMHFCLYIQIYCQMAILLLGLPGYFSLEWFLWQERKKSPDLKTDSAASLYIIENHNSGCNNFHCA